MSDAVAAPAGKWETPIYNAYIMLKIAGRPGWWLLLYFIPPVNLAILVVVAMDVSKSFGQSAAWGSFFSCFCAASAT